MARPQNYAEIIAELEPIIAREMADKQLPAFFIALVDDQETVWAKGFGKANPEKGIEASAETVHRIASVSKLFTDIAIMQLVEAGKLDLDAPITTYLPEFKPKNPFNKAITLRQLTSHRSGLVREPPEGNYFNPSPATLKQTAVSLNRTELVYEPESRTKYSNAAVTLAGYIVEKVQGEPFAGYMQRAVLQPMGLSKSSFVLEPHIVRDMAQGYMWGYDRPPFLAPTFELGMSPAAGMYSTVGDLARFMSVLFNGGRGGRGPVLQSATLERMWQIQFIKPGQKQGFGLGFFVSELSGERSVSHSGVHYGFATQLTALPEAKLGAVAITTMDNANEVVERIVDHSLKLMLAQQRNEKAPEFPLSKPAPAELAQKLQGEYADAEGAKVVLENRSDRLFMWRGAIRSELKLRPDTLITDDRLTYGTQVIPVGSDCLMVAGKSFVRAPVQRPSSAPDKWRGLIGEYGWDHNTLFILERDGQLCALIEWFFLYPLKEISAEIFSFPDFGLYTGEKLIFKRDAHGQATEVVAASVLFKRRNAGREEGKGFRLQPVKSVNELRRSALKDKPPVESGNFASPDLVNLAELDRTLKFEIRYATTNNFLGAKFYDKAEAYLQRPAAEALLRAHRRLKERGYGLLIFDAYRPWHVTKMFWEATPADKKIFVADPAKGSRHNRGAAVDLTLYDLRTGKVVEMVSGYDEFSPRAYPEYPGGTSLQRYHRELVRRAMEAEGFRVYAHEWWHFDYREWEKYPIMNMRFEEIR